MKATSQVLSFKKDGILEIHVFSEAKDKIGGRPAVRRATAMINRNN